jgi:hypothetical protein
MNAAETEQAKKAVGCGDMTIRTNLALAFNLRRKDDHVKLAAWLLVYKGPAGI